jgi:hypothetical protein
VGENLAFRSSLRARSVVSMKNAPALLFVVLSAIAVTGCGDKRNTMNSTPERGTHSVGAAGAQNGQDMLVPGPTEAMYTSKAGDTLTSIAKAHGETLSALIARNRIKEDQNPPKVGTQFIVPRAK